MPPKTVKRAKAAIPPSEKPATPAVLFTSFVLLVAAIGCFIWFLLNHTELVDVVQGRARFNYPVQESVFTIVDYIKPTPWEKDRPFARSAVAGERPMVFTNTALTDWKAMSLWTPTYLKNYIPKTITGVYMSTNKVFGPLWRPNKPMAAMKELINRNPHQVVSMTADKFMQRVENGSTDGQWAYYTGNLNAGAELIAQTQPIEEILLDHPEHVNVWVGEKGVETHLHCDTYENFFVQIYGRKRFLLFPPNQTDNLYLFPFIHPSFGQAQVNLSHPDTTLFPKFPLAKSYEVTLGPGDVLYLPPLWLHHVIALQPSISVNAWSTSEAQRKFDAAIQGVVKNVDSTWSLAEKRSASRLLITSILHRLSSKDSCVGESTCAADGSSGAVPEAAGSAAVATAARFIRTLFKTRYNALVTTGQLSMEAIDGLCDDHLNTAIRERVALITDKVVPLLLDISPSIRHTFVGNLVEALSLWAPGANQAAPYLKKCFLDPADAATAM